MGQPLTPGQPQRSTSPRSPLSSSLSLPTPPQGWPIGSYPTYAEAQRAVDYLSDQQFPVENVTIVGVNLMQVERVTGRLSWPKVLGGGMLSGAWLGLFIGLVLGVLIAFAVVWYLNKSPFPFLDKGGHADRSEARPTGDAPMPLPGKPGDKVSEKPRFEFYKILPGGDAAQLMPAPAPQPPAVQSQPAAPVASETFYLQAGAFQKAADADNLKAKLAMMGLDTDVQEANLPDKGVMYRVRVGPYSRPDEMNKARSQLAQNGIQATVVKTAGR